MTTKMVAELPGSPKPQQPLRCPLAEEESSVQRCEGGEEPDDSAQASLPRETAAGQIEVSVIVPVYGRPDQLEHLLTSLVRQDYRAENFEVLVCDDGSREDVKTVVEEFARVASLNVSYLRQGHQGAGAARNLGLAHARGKILAFTDSDCEAPENWLSELVVPFRTASVGIVGGPIDYRSANHISGRCMNYVMSTALGAGGARDPRAVVRMAFRPRTYNCAVRASLARQVGGFPGGTYGEDTEFSHRVAELGEIRFVPTAAVVHHEKRTLWQAGETAFRKGAARVTITLRCGGHQLIHALPAGLCFYLGGLLAAMLWRGSVAWWSLVPAMIYATALASLSLHGTVRLASLSATVCVPLYAAVMHVGYGLGYLYGWCMALMKQIELPRPKERRV